MFTLVVALLLDPAAVLLLLAARRRGAHDAEISTAIAAPLEDALTAYRRGDYPSGLLRELTFWSTRNVGATISDAASPVDEIEKLKARHTAEIERIVEVAQESVEKVVQEALEDADRPIEELRAYRAQIKGFGFTEAQVVDQPFKWQLALAAPTRSGRSGR